MNINVQVKLSSENCSWLCFRHAVIQALEGEDIEMEIGDFDSDYYLGSTICGLCIKEDLEKESQHAKEISKTLKIGE